MTLKHIELSPPKYKLYEKLCCVIILHREERVEKMEKVLHGFMCCTENFFTYLPFLNFPMSENFSFLFWIILYEILFFAQLFIFELLLMT